MDDKIENQEEQETKSRKPPGYWNDYDRCRLAAVECTHRADFKSKYTQAYRVSLKNGWINDYVWLEEGYKIAGGKRRVYDYQECYQRAQQYSTIKEFEKNDKGACVAARRNGWLGDYTWFTRLWERKWDRESCYFEAQKFQSLAAFASESNSCYSTAVNNNWLDDYTWLERKRVKPGTWQVYENCYNEALKFKSRTELENKAPGCYEGARENGWLDSFTWLNDERIDLIEGKIDSVYVYEFTEQNAAYIGRTLASRQRKRDLEHLWRNDSVNRFAQENDIPIPEMKILEDNLTLKEGVEREKLYVQEYKNKGWNVLNKAKPGSIGGLAKGKYTKQGCYDTACSCATLKSLMEEHWGVYVAALKHDWLKDYTWLERKHIQSVKNWTYEMCLEDSKRFKTRGEYAEKSSSSYNKARKEGWLENFTWLQPKRHPTGYWTKERCLEEGRNHKTRSEWQHANQMSYKTARENGWLDECTWLEKPSRKKKNTQELTSEE